MGCGRKERWALQQHGACAGGCSKPSCAGLQPLQRPSMCNSFGMPQVTSWVPPAPAATGSPRACRCRRSPAAHAVHVAVWLPPAAAGHRLHALLPAAGDRPGRVAVHLVSPGLDGWAGTSEHGACIGSALLPGGPAPLEPALTPTPPAVLCSPAGSALQRSATQSTASPARRAARSNTMPPTSRWASLSPKRP